MPFKKLKFRPLLQELENRRCLTGVLGTENLAETLFEQAQGGLSPVTSLESTTSARTVNSEFQGGGGIFNDTLADPTHSTNDDFFAYPGFSGGVRVATGDINGDGTPEIITGFRSTDGNQLDALSGTMDAADNADAFFRELGDDTSDSAGDSFRYTIADNLGQPSA